MKKKPKGKPKTKPIEIPRKVLERTILGLSLLFCSALFTFCFMHKDDPNSMVGSLIKSFSGSVGLGDVNYNVNCSLDKNKDSPYCQEKRGKVQETWRSVSVMGSKGSKYRLYKK